MRTFRRNRKLQLFSHIKECDTDSHPSMMFGNHNVIFWKCKEYEVLQVLVNSKDMKGNPEKLIKTQNNKNQMALTLRLCIPLKRTSVYMLMAQYPQWETQILATIISVLGPASFLSLYTGLRWQVTHKTLGVTIRNSGLLS